MPQTTSHILEFVKLIGALKEIERFRGQVFWKDYPQQARYDSVADHTWRMAMILVLGEKHLSRPIDLAKALKMVLLHDLPEIKTGDLSPLGSDGTGQDSHLYNKEAAQKKYENEERAMKEMLSGLPADQAKELYDIWEEFEDNASFEAKVVKAIDKIEGKLQATEYLNGHMFAKHLDFTLKYGADAMEVDPFTKELGELLNKKMKEDFKEFTV